MLKGNRLKFYGIGWEQVKSSIEWVRRSSEFRWMKTGQSLDGSRWILESRWTGRRDLESVKRIIAFKYSKLPIANNCEFNCSLRGWTIQSDEMLEVLGEFLRFSWCSSGRSALLRLFFVNSGTKISSSKMFLSERNRRTQSLNASYSHTIQNWRQIDTANCWTVAVRCVRNTFCDKIR